MRDVTNSTAIDVGAVATIYGLWLSLVERLVRDQEAVGSNPTSPMKTFSRHNYRVPPPHQ
jgi:hypothetical protein